MRLKSRPEVIAIGDFSTQAKSAWKTLEERGFAIIHVESIHAGIEQAGKHQFDLVLLGAGGADSSEIKALIERFRASPNARSAYAPLMLMVDVFPSREELGEVEARVSAMFSSDACSNTLVRKVVSHCGARPIRVAA